MVTNSVEILKTVPMKNLKKRIIYSKIGEKETEFNREKIQFILDHGSLYWKL